MVHTLYLAQLGDIADATVARWLKQEGDSVALDDPLLEVVTEKVNAEMTSAYAGRLTRILVAEGESIPIGAPIAEIDDLDEIAAR